MTFALKNIENLFAYNKHIKEEQLSVIWIDTVQPMYDNSK